MSDCQHTGTLIRYDTDIKSYVTTCRNCRKVLKSYLVEDTTLTAFFKRNRERNAPEKD